MIRRPPRSTHCISSAASDVYKRQVDLSPKGKFAQNNKQNIDETGDSQLEQQRKRKSSFVLYKEGDAEEQAKLENLRKKNRLTDELYVNHPLKMSAFRKSTL
eukprot:TRINITY_DN6650_c0_g1_i2.p3 TRINITY_DN6650_c0_g1~~TRINITY_DN6650_c0_g1_i2.p3  ORF type:complete len:102 (-),score=38.63 TRINITY_DN6650_c0_g1_i2:540-845(-)